MTGSAAAPTSAEGDFDSVFANLVHLRASGLVIGGGGFFFSRGKQLAALAIRHAARADEVIE
jgi:putative tryptophan/tyrosine transport system substrate-binding protein